MLQDLISKFITGNKRWFDLDLHHKGIFLQLIVFASLNDNKIPNSTRTIKSYFKTAQNVQKAIMILANFFQQSANGKYWYSPFLETIEMELTSQPYVIKAESQPPVMEAMDDLEHMHQQEAPINTKYSNPKKFEQIISYNQKQLKIQIIESLQGLKLEYALALLNREDDKVAQLFHSIDRSALPELLKRLERNYFNAQEELYNLHHNPKKNDNGTNK